MTNAINLPLKQISINGGTQARVEINQAIVAEYADAIRQGTDFPAVVVFEDGAAIWLADGFHRFHAHNAAGAMDILCDVRTGTQRDAVLYSLSANSHHGLRRTNEDKRRAAETMLKDAEWATWSDNSISRACGVSVSFIGDVRRSIYSPTIDTQEQSTRTVERNGTTYEQNTAKIGKAVPAVNPEPFVMPESDFEQMYKDSERENDVYISQIKSLQTDDKDRELNRLNQYVDQLNGRLNGEITTKNEAQKQAKYYGELLMKIRKALNVESNDKILSKLESL